MIIHMYGNCCGITDQLYHVHARNYRSVHARANKDVLQIAPVPKLTGHAINSADVIVLRAGPKWNGLKEWDTTI